MEMKISLILMNIAFSCAMKVEYNIVIDIINAMNRPATIIYFFCESPREMIKFTSQENVTGIKMLQLATTDNTSSPNLANREQYIVFAADLSCPGVDKYIETCYQRKYFRAPYRWILLQNQNEISEIPPRVIEQLDISVDTEVFIVTPIEEKAFEINAIYKITSESSWSSELYGFWNITHGFQKKQDFNDVTALRRHNLEGHQLKICYVLTDNDSINHLTDQVNDHIDTITKVNFPTTNHLLDFLNADRKYVFANTWGYRLNGTWNGMTGYLVRGEVEIGGSPMFFTTERIPFVDYISSPTPTRSKFVFQEPKLSYENNLFLLSFRTTVWYSTLALIFILFLALFLVTYWEWKQKRNIESRETDSAILRPNIGDVIVLIFGATCQQGSSVELKGSLGRIVLLILFLTLMFLYTSYSANIVALLQSSSSKIRTLDDLLHSRIKFGVHDTVFNRYYFSTATEPVRKAIYEKKVAPPGSAAHFMSLEDGVKKIRKGLFAFHMETGVGYKFVGKYFEEGEKCGLKEIQYLQVIDPWLAVKKDTPYKEMFKIGLKRIQEHGLQNRENRLLYEKKPKCSGRDSSFVSVSMVDCYPALLALSYGCLVALAVLLMEKLHYCRHVIKRKFVCGHDNNI